MRVWWQKPIYHLLNYVNESLYQKTMNDIYFDRFQFLVNENQKANTINEINERIDFAYNTLQKYGNNLEISHIYIGIIQRRILLETTLWYDRITDANQPYELKYRGITMHELSYQKSHWYIALKKT